MRKEQEGD